MLPSGVLDDQVKRGGATGVEDRYRVIAASCWNDLILIMASWKGCGCPKLWSDARRLVRVGPAR
jgi:hypothetical protein